MKKEYDILIIGAGPAGLTAASVCARRDVSITLVDMERAPGGRVLKETEDALTLKHATDSEHRESAALGRLLKGISSKIDYYSGSLLADIADKCAILDGPLGQTTIVARSVILAPGAVEAPALFPNWNMPGIYTLGGYNTMIKRGQKLKEKTLVAGSGPLLYALAANVGQGGGSMVGLLDAASLGQNIQLGRALLAGRYYGKMALAAKAGLALIGPKWRRRTRIASVSGRAGDFKIKTVIMDDNWKTIKDGPTFQTEAIAASYGLHPNTDLSRRCGCLHTYDFHSGIWTPVLDSCLRTSRPGIYLAGDGALVKGYEGAAVDGKIAGLAALMDLGQGLGYESELFDLQKSRRACEDFALKLASVSEPGPAYFNELADDITVCRCESVRIRDIKRAAAEGARDRNGIKKRLRIGMGHCQGRYCGQVIDRILAGLIKAEHVPQQYTPRTPVMPVRIGVLAGEAMNVDEEFRV